MKAKLVHVPTVAELAEDGLATATKTGKATAWKIKKKGYARIAEAQARNAELLKPLVDDVAAKRAVLDKAIAKLKKLEATRVP